MKPIYVKFDSFAEYTEYAEYVINDMNGEEIIASFYEKKLQKTDQEEFRIEKIIKRKGNK